MKKKVYISLKKLQAIDRKEAILTILYMYFIVFLNLITRSDHINQLIPDYILVANMVWIFVSSKNYPNCLNKELFLCPMTKEEQKYYLVRHYRKKIMCNMGIYIGCSSIFVAIGWMNLSGMFALMLSQFLLNITSHIHVDTSAIEKKYNSEAYGLKNYEGSRIGLILISILAWAVIRFYAIYGSKILGIAMIMALSVQVLASFYFLKRYSKPIFEYATNSEMIYLQQVDKKGVQKTR